MVPAAIAFLVFLQTPDYDAEGAKALDAGNYQAAADSFTKAITADPTDYYAHFNLAMAYTYLKKNEEGLAEYRKTLELKPGLYEAELNGGILSLREKNPADALPLLEDASTQKPKEFAPRIIWRRRSCNRGWPARRRRITARRRRSIPNRQPRS